MIDFSDFAHGIHFVSGIDTDAGKTYATGWLARELMLSGRSVATMKLVQTGSQGGSQDLEMHRKIMGTHLPEDESGITFPAVFTYPASPHLAAEIDAKDVPVKRMLECAEILRKNYDTVLVEGAGGLAVPLTRELLTVDFAAQCKWPVILVTNGKLGSVNHTILSLEALKSRAMTLSALIFNAFNPVPDAVIEKDAREYLFAYAAKNHPPALRLNCPVIEF